MKFLHISDLHLGKSIHGLSMLDQGDQPFWVERFLALAREERPDAVLIAGDVYDRGFPSGEATQLFSHLLTELAEAEIPVLISAGNHDSVERLSFASELLARQRVYISRPLRKGEELVHVTLQDEYGPVTFWLMPYLFPSLVAQALEQDDIHDMDTAMRRLLEAQDIRPGERNVVVAHQYVTENGEEPQRGGSESMVGGVGQIDWHAFDGLEYVALGHIHAAYPVGRTGIRYCGSPLCYHFEETKQARKGPLAVTLGPKGTEPEVAPRMIEPLHPMRELRGAYGELLEQELATERRGEYLRVVVTDRLMTPEVYEYFHTLARSRDSRVLAVSSEYQLFQGTAAGADLQAIQEKPVEALFADFYTERHNGSLPAEEDQELMTFLGEITRHADVREEPTDAEALKALEFLTRQEERLDAREVEQ